MSTTINGFHLFTVKEYSRLKAMDVGNLISSGTFTVGGHDWEIYFCLNGKDRWDQNYVSVFLWDQNYVSVFLGLINHDGTNVEASVEFTLLDQSGKGKHYAKSSLNNRYTTPDRICCIRTKKITIIPPPPEMEKDLKCLLDSEIGSDIVFRVEDVTFKAHKVILAARSPVFKAQFYGLVGNPANLEEVELLDIEPSVFKAMLLFIYTEKLPDSQESMGSMSNMIKNLMVAADRFGLDRLKQLCEAKLCEQLNVDVVATTLSLAHDHNCSQLKTICMDFAVANLRAVIQTEGYKYVEKSCPILLLELLPKIAELLQKTASES